MRIRVETWSRHKIRFVEVEPGEWWAVAKDVADALDYSHTPHMMRLIDVTEKDVRKVDTPGGLQSASIISELGIYDAIFGSHRPEAKEFKKWVFQMLKKLRQSSGLAGFEVFRMMDKNYQKQMMAELDQGIERAQKKHYLKANTIANKAISTLHGYPKMIGKKQMTPNMLRDREPILRDTVDLMVTKERFKLDGLHVSKVIYSKYAAGDKDA